MQPAPTPVIVQVDRRLLQQEANYSGREKHQADGNCLLRHIRAPPAQDVPEVDAHGRQHDERKNRLEPEIIFQTCKQLNGILSQAGSDRRTHLGQEL